MSGHRVSALFFDRPWYKDLVQAVANVFSFISGYVFWRTFPLNLSESLARVVNLALIFLLIFTAFVYPGRIDQHSSQLQSGPKK